MASYTGIFNSYSISEGTGGLGYFWVNNHGDVELFPGMSKLYRNNQTLMWEGYKYQIPLSPEFGLQYSASIYWSPKSLNTRLRKLGLQKPMPYN